eukprot:gene20543-8928_t
MGSGKSTSKSGPPGELRPSGGGRVWPFGRRSSGQKEQHAAGSSQAQPLQAGVALSAVPVPSGRPRPVLVSELEQPWPPPR